MFTHYTVGPMMQSYILISCKDTVKIKKIEL